MGYATDSTAYARLVRPGILEMNNANSENSRCEYLQFFRSSTLSVLVFLFVSAVSIVTRSDTCTDSYGKEIHVCLMMFLVACFTREIYFNKQRMDVTSTVMIRVDTIDRIFKEHRAVGYALIAIFMDPSGKQVCSKTPRNRRMVLYSLEARKRGRKGVYTRRTELILLVLYIFVLSASEDSMHISGQGHIEQVTKGERQQ